MGTQDLQRVSFGHNELARWPLQVMQLQLTRNSPVRSIALKIPDEDLALLRTTFVERVGYAFAKADRPGAVFQHTVLVQDVS
jgi:hypothetical protein